MPPWSSDSPSVRVRTRYVAATKTMKSLAMPDLGAYNPRAQSRGWGRLADVVVGIGLVGALIAAVFGLLDLSHLARGTPARRIGLVNKGLSSSPCPCRG